MLYPDKPQVYYLHPGDVAVGFSGDTFETLLGSCVSILLVSPCFRVAAICHYVHSSQAPKNKLKDASYALVAMNKMDHMLRRYGFNAHLCRAYVFGGGNMFPGNNNVVDVGQQNVNWALNYLSHKKIPVFGSETGDNYYRKLSWQVGASNPCDHLLTVLVSSI